MTMLHDRLRLMRELLSEGGSLYVHIDENMLHYVKVVADEIFGDTFRNDIVVRSTFAHADANQFGSVHQNVLFYTKTNDRYRFEPVYVPYEDEYVQKYYRYRDPDGRRWLSCMEDLLLDRGMISPADMSLFKVTDSVQEAVDEVLGFYRVYHSMRYVGRDLVLRLKQPLAPGLLDHVQTEFADILESGLFEQTGALPAEANDTEVAHFPRLRFRFDRRNAEARLWRACEVEQAEHAKGADSDGKQPAG